jgi:hypothetical protein
MVARARFASRSRRISGIPQASQPVGQQDEELAQEAHMRRSASVAPALSRARPFGRRPDLCWFFQRVSPYELDNISIIHHHFPAVRTLQCPAMNHDGT